MAIHNRDGEPVLPTDDSQEPFFLFCDGVPLPIAVKQGVHEAQAWRDAWEQSASPEMKRWHCFHPTKRNWMGGAEDGVATVREAQSAWFAEG
jgi:hypothetical protein